MTRFALTLVALAMGTPALLAQSECDGERYRYTSTYDNVSVSAGHVYGGNLNVNGVDTELDFDFYERWAMESPTAPCSSSPTAASS